MHSASLALEVTATSRRSRETLSSPAPPVSSAPGWPARWRRPESSIRCLVRDRSRAPLARGGRVRTSTWATSPTPRASTARARDVEVAYYLVHAMAGAGGSPSESRSARATSPGWPSAEGVRRVVYLGGLGDESKSKHLRSRHETARILAADGPPLTYFRAAMVVGAGSESYRTLRYLVGRLPVMIAPTLAAHSHAADRHRRDDRVPATRSRGSRVQGPGGTDRRPRRPLLLGDAGSDGDRDGQGAAAQAAGAPSSPRGCRRSGSAW